MNSLINAIEKLPRSEYRTAPKEIYDALGGFGEVRVHEHLPGKHDQKTHGRRFGGKYNTWDGRVDNATPDEERTIRRVMGMVPQDLLQGLRGIRMEDKLENENGEYYGEYLAKRIFINRNLYNENRNTSQASFNDRVILHEVGHHVWDNDRYPDYVPVQHAEVSGLVKEWKDLNPYASEQIDFQELFSEAFAVRTNTGRYMGPESEVVFERLGI